MSKVNIAQYDFSISQIAENAYRLKSTIADTPYARIATALLDTGDIQDLTATDDEIVIFGAEPKWENFTNIELEDGNIRSFILPVCFDLGTDWPGYLKETRLGKDFATSLLMDSQLSMSFIGFQPGFLYIDGLDQRLWCPRKAKVERLEKGSIAIGAKYLGCYPNNGIGGWHVLGKTPIKCFDISNVRPSLVNPGDQIAIEKISAKDYKVITQSDMNLMEFNGM